MKPEPASGSPVENPTMVANEVSVRRSGNPSPPSVYAVADRLGSNATCRVAVATVDQFRPPSLLR